MKLETNMIEIFKIHIFCCFSPYIHGIFIADVALAVYTCNSNIVPVNNDRNRRTINCQSVCDSFTEGFDDLSFMMLFYAVYQLLSFINSLIGSSIVSIYTTVTEDRKRIADHCSIRHELREHIGVNGYFHFSIGISHIPHIVFCRCAAISV